MIEADSAVVRPRIYSAKKHPLETIAPLKTPISVHIDVASLCNFRCSFCFQADTVGMKKVGLKRGFMPVALFKKIVDDLKDFPQKIKKIKIGNHGEPTLHPDLPEMIAYAKKAQVSEIIELFTNGSKLEPRLNAGLVESGLQRINVSLEGLSDERYKAVAGKKINFKSIVDGVRNLYSLKSSDLTIYVKIADHAHALSDSSTKIFVLSTEERKYFFDTFSGICDEIYIEKVVPQWAETQDKKQNELKSTGMYGQKIKQNKDVCPFTFMYLHFNCDGTVSPCTLDWPRKVVVGNAKHQKVKDIWFSKRMRQLQIAMLLGKRGEINFCNNCSAPLVCLDEDLDPHKDEVLSKMYVTEKEMEEPNPWVSQ